jgi:Immunoglobulin I-set domain
MKLSKNIRSLVKYLAVAATAFSLATTVKAHPYASAVTNKNGTIQFILNEGGGTVNVVFEDGTTNAMGVLPQGTTNFSLGSHTSYSIYVTKTGNGTPSLISTDTNQFSLWPSPRGVDANKNPKLGYLFGRVYVGNSTPGGTSPNNKGQGLYALNADLSDSPLGHGANATGGGIFIAGFGANGTSGASGPYRVRVAPDNTLLVGDFSTANAALWQYAPDLTSSNLVLGVIGENQGIAAGIHGDFFGTPLMTGSLANSNLVLWTADPGMPVPSGTANLGPNTAANQNNCIYRYDIGAGPLPWTNSPNYAYTVGLSGIAELRPEVDLGKDGKIIAGFGRANLSNPDIQILDPTGSTLLYLSGDTSQPLNQNNSPTVDPWNGINGSRSAGGTYCGVRVSPDGRFLASVDINNGITLATLTNGIPDDSSIFGIQNASNVGNARGMCWDAADNIYVVSSGQGLLRVYSLGISTTCVTSNDFTGTNGSFQLVVPNATATVVATQPQASQNYINNLSAGTPIPGVFKISLDQSQLAAPVTVNFTRSGTATYLTNFTMNLGTDVNGVIISSNSVTFPAGAHPGGGNWSVDVQIIPTATPVSGPNLTVGFRILGGPSYLAGTPATGTVNIANTGPQLLLLSPASLGATMSRGVPNDYAAFIITRFGDTNGPGNSATSVSPTSYTVTNFTYLGTAAFPGDYTARAQRTDPSGNGVIATPTDGSPGIVIYPGNVSITNMVGNPVSHANLSQPPVNVTIVVSLTNAVTTTNATSSEGFAYSVSNNAVTLTELDNTIGPEVVLWSNPLTNSTDSTNWTLTFASTSFATNTTLPVVIPNYSNDFSSIIGGGTNNFRVEFGNPIASDSVSPSAAMSANGWNTALRMTVNKDGPGAVSGVNLYPQGMKFQGNYAFRFSMYLSLWSFAINNPSAGTTPREFAAFGINHDGTNCDWRLATPIAAGTGNSTTNADGIWFAIDAGINSITPADFDAFASPALPNAGVTADLVSNNTASQSGVFKHPPFASMTSFTPGLGGGGEPVNQWVDVSVEVSAQTNVTLYMNRSAVLTSFSITNGGGYTSGTPMLGYLDPVSDVSDNSAFAYYSNVRVVELSPYIVAQPVSLIATQGANVAFVSTAAFGTAPITNVWFLGNTNPVVAVQTDTANATNLTSTLSLNNVQTGTNYVAVFSDLAGSVTGLVRSLEVITPPVSITTNTGATIRFAVTASGQSAPTSFQWKTNGVNLANNSHFAGVTTGTLTITNVGSFDAGTYTVAVTNAAGGLLVSATLTVNVPLPPTFSTVSLVGTNVVLSFGSPNPFDTTTSFILQSSTVVQGPYTNTPGVFTGSSGSFQVTSPQTGGNRFYRLLHI